MSAPAWSVPPLMGRDQSRRRRHHGSPPPLLRDEPAGCRHSAAMRAISRETGIGVAVSALTVGAMAIDHLVGTDDEPGDDPGLADPPAFLISGRYRSPSRRFSSASWSGEPRRPIRILRRRRPLCAPSWPSRCWRCSFSVCRFRWPERESRLGCWGVRVRGGESRPPRSRLVRDRARCRRVRRRPYRLGRIAFWPTRTA